MTTTRTLRRLTDRQLAEMSRAQLGAHLMALDIRATCARADIGNQCYSRQLARVRAEIARRPAEVLS